MATSPSEEPRPFREVQYPTTWMRAVGLAAVSLGISSVLLPLGDRRVDPWIGVAVALPLVALAWGLTRVRLVTDVGDQGVRVRFRGLLIDRTFPFAEIQRAYARRYRPVWHYGGWGLRWGLGGVAYNIRGDRGVQLELSGGRRVLIGSQRAEELASAIQRALSR